MQFTREQILQLAPDDSSAKAGQQLATAGKWVVRCAHELALWGDCQGSGSQPYRTMIDLQNTAFKCSCPSRKFPCKHGLGLLLLFHANPESFTKPSDLAPQVDEWLSKRNSRAEAKEQREQKPVDEKAQQKRVESREKKIDAGIEELRLWMKDIVRTGISGLPPRAYQFAQNITARMVDAQAGGLAAQLRKMQRINYFQDGWQVEFMRQLSQIYLIADAYQRSEQLPLDWQQELKSLVGWTVPKEEVLAGTGVKDKWTVLSKTQEEDGNLEVERIWLRGQQTGRFGLLLNFYAAQQLPQHLLTPGGVLVGELAYFPGVALQRALIKEQQGILGQFEPIGSGGGIRELHETVAEHLAFNPFTDRIPVLLQGLRLSLNARHWQAVDASGQAIQLHNAANELWKALAVTAGKPFDAFGVWELGQFSLHSLWSGPQFHSLK